MFKRHHLVLTTPTILMKKRLWPAQAPPSARAGGCGEAESSHRGQGAKQGSRATPVDADIHALMLRKQEIEKLLALS